MIQAATFADIVDAAGSLPAEEQEALIDILRHRLAEQGRQRIIAEVREAEEDFRAGRCRPTTVDDLMREITS